MKDLITKTIVILILILCESPSIAAFQNSINDSSSYTSEQLKVKMVDGTERSVDSLNAFIEQAMKQTGVPGLSVAIINQKEIVYHESFGTVNIETGEPVTKTTIFEAASLSKPIFAYFTLKMVENGKIDLDKPMHDYLPHPAIAPESQESYKKITPRMILSHSTGFPNWSEGEKIHLSHEPGDGYSYSGEAYQYLAAVIGQQNGVGWKADLDSVFRKTVAIPLGMDNSYFTWNEYLAKHKATGHQSGKPTNNKDQGESFGAAYSLHTDADDFARFLIEMMEGKHLSDTLLSEMLKEQNAFTEENELMELGQTGWGLGFARRPTKHGMRHMHTGNNHDFQSYACLYKNKGFGLVLLTNGDRIEPFYEKLGAFINDEF